MSDLETARALDAKDPLRKFRDAFHFPTAESGDPLIYLCGNSLGLQPKTARDIVNEELDAWAEKAVDAHVEGARPWYGYHEMFAEPLAAIVGAEPVEVVAMNSLTSNLHLLMVSFYQPNKTRYKIVIEKSAFPSDQYVVASQAAFHGFDPKDAVVVIEPREGESLIQPEDTEAYLEKEGDSVALVMFGGVNYYTGQAFDFERLTKAAHKAGAKIGFDLAHAVGNLKLSLHDWGVDFAAWCSYKYLNAGPGGVGGAFVHERYKNDTTLPRFAGWWGNDPAKRFEMTSEFVPAPGVNGWQLSNAPILSMATLKASLDIFAEAGMDRIREKSIAMTEYLLSQLDLLEPKPFDVITPRDAKFRGSQLSLRARKNGAGLYEALQTWHVACDFRRPDVVRVAPAPLYNSFEDLWTFSEIIRNTRSDYG